MPENIESSGSDSELSEVFTQTEQRLSNLQSSIESSAADAGEDESAGVTASDLDLRTLISPEAQAEHLIDNLKTHAQSPNVAERAQLHWLNIALRIPSSQREGLREQVRPILRRLVTDPEIEVRKKMAQDPLLLDDFPELRNLLVEDRSPDVRKAIVEDGLWFRFNASEEIIDRLLADPDASVRVATLRHWHPLMGGIERAAALLLQDPVEAVREAARHHPLASWLKNPTLRGVLKGWARQRAQRSAHDTRQETEAPRQSSSQ